MTKRKTIASKDAKGTKSAKRGASVRPGYTALTVEVRNGFALLSLARPEVHNAFERR